MNETGQSAVFGRRREPHTVIIARGNEIRHFTIRPWLAAFLGSALAAIAIGYLLATSYLVLRDDLIGAATARQARMQQAYEDRISALRAQVDRITSRQLLDQQLMETKVGELLERQAQLSSATAVSARSSNAPKMQVGRCPPRTGAGSQARRTCRADRQRAGAWPMPLPASATPRHQAVLASGRPAADPCRAKRRPTAPTGCSSRSTSRCARSRPSRSAASTRWPTMPTRPPTRSPRRSRPPACRSTGDFGKTEHRRSAGRRSTAR